MALAEEIERLIGVINANIERRFHAVAAEPEDAGADTEARLAAIFDDEAKAITDMADECEDRGEVLMADLLRGVRDDQLQRLLR